jgi:hypothetical protein
MNLPECHECRSIVIEFKAAIRALNGEMAQSRLGSDQEFAQAWRQARELKTEEDVALAEELFPAVQFNSSHKVGLVFRRMFTHEARTGHHLRRLLRRT